jgi:hypothetical protein
MTMKGVGKPCGYIFDHPFRSSLSWTVTEVDMEICVGMLWGTECHSLSRDELRTEKVQAKELRSL